MSAPSCPRELTAEERREWKRLTAELREAGTLHSADRALLVLWVQTWILREKARSEIAKIGSEVVRGAAGGAELNKWYSIARHAEATLLRIAAELGLSPTSRARLDHAGTAEDLEQLREDLEELVSLDQPAAPDGPTINAGWMAQRREDADEYRFSCPRCCHEAVIAIPHGTTDTRCPKCGTPAHAVRSQFGPLGLHMGKEAAPPAAAVRSAALDGKEK